MIVGDQESQYNTWHIKTNLRLHFSVTFYIGSVVVSIVP